jgi:eukaryotic-like serine/threonine-protein kinase
MELIEGPTLAYWIATLGALALPDALRATDELLAALAYAHGQGVLHRDVKPENVMFAKRGPKTSVVLIDFGLARLRDDAGITQQGACMGSPSYVAPERLLGTGSDERSDLYSVGIVLYEMLSGQRPFGSGEPQDIALRQLEAAPPPITELRVDLPPALVALVTRALDKDPEKRFASADEFRGALARVATGSGPIASRGRLTSSIAAMPRAPTMPPPIPQAALRTRPITVTPPAVPAAGSSQDGMPTLSWRMGNESWWRRLYAWCRHGSWRWT